MDESEKGRWSGWLASTRVTTLLLAALLGELLLAGWVVAHEGAWDARRMVFANWLGGLPCLCAIGAAHLVALLFARRHRKPWRAGLLVAHAGVFLLLLSGALAPLLSKVSVIDLGPQERVAVAGVPGRWELALVPRDGPVATRSLGEVVEGVTIRFGGKDCVVVAGYAANGVLGVDLSPIALPAVDDPVGFVPAIAFDAWVAGASPTRVALDGNRPVARAGGGGVFALRRRARALPFALELRPPFRDPARDIPVRFAEAGGAMRNASIRFDRPLAAGRFSIFLSPRGTDPRAGSGRVVLSVVENPLVDVPGWAALLVFAGLSLHGVLGFSRRAGLLGAALLLPWVSPSAARADPLPAVPPSLMTLPIQVDGQAVSFASHAERTLLQISGQAGVEGIDAPRWFAALLFDPRQVRELPVFAILDPRMRDALGVPSGDAGLQPWSRMESAESVLTVLADAAGRKTLRNRGAPDREALRLREGWKRYRDVENAFAFLRPSSVAPFPGGPVPAARFLDLTTRSEEFAGVVDSLVARRFTGDSLVDPGLLVWLRATFDASDAWASARFPVLPRRGFAGAWESPAAAIARDGAPEPSVERVLLDWDSLRAAWLRGDAPAAETAAKRLRDTLVARAGPSLRPPAMWAESVSNRARPFRWALGFFGAALVACGAAVPSRRGWLRGAGDLLSTAGLACVLGGLLLRMATNLRPPLGNAHELLLAGCAVTVSVFLYASRSRGWRPGSLAAATAGAAHLVLASAFGRDGVSTPAIEAVLRSRFLSQLHAGALAAGVACLAVAAASGHAHLFRSRSGRSAGDESTRAALLAGLWLLVAGIVASGCLGWLDRGRVWCWSPSEIGMLAIGLWCALLLHARESGLLAGKAFAVGAVATLPLAALCATTEGLGFAGLRQGGASRAYVWSFAVWCLLDGAFVAWLLLARKARQAWRGVLLWRIRYVRSRNPRLRRHGDTGGWGEESQNAR